MTSKVSKILFCLLIPKELNMINMYEMNGP
jgi:hypothetical protein